MKSAITIPLSHGTITGPLIVSNGSGVQEIGVNLHGKVGFQFESIDDEYPTLPGLPIYQSRYSFPRIKKFRLILEVEPSMDDDHQLTFRTKPRVDSETLTPLSGVRLPTLRR